MLIFGRSSGDTYLIHLLQNWHCLLCTHFRAFILVTW